MNYELKIWLVKNSHMTSFNQSECMVSSKHNYDMIKVDYAMYSL